MWRPLVMVWRDVLDVSVMDRRVFCGANWLRVRHPARTDLKRRHFEEKKRCLQKITPSKDLRQTSANSCTPRMRMNVRGNVAKKIFFLILTNSNFSSDSPRIHLRFAWPSNFWLWAVQCRPDAALSGFRRWIRVWKSNLRLEKQNFRLEIENSTL